MTASWTMDLLQWYTQHKRPLPWRENKDPYRIWVSEIMLQQTRVEAVKPYFENWFRTFPTMEDAAAASEEELLKAWQGLGYYSRVRNLQQGIRKVVSTYSGEIPRDRSTLETIKGIGPYTAGALLSIAFNAPEAAVDGNVLRIYARLYGIHKDILSTEGKKEIRRLVEETLPREASGDFNEALMDFGSAICIPKHPRCDDCPLQIHCVAYKEGTTDVLPIRKKKKAPRKEAYSLYLIRRPIGTGYEYLLHRRTEGVLINMWEIPSKELVAPYFEQGEIPLPKEEDLPFLDTVEHRFSHIVWTLRLYGPITLSETGNLWEVEETHEHDTDTAHGSSAVASMDETDREEGPNQSVLEKDWCWLRPQDIDRLPWAGPHGALSVHLK